MFSQLLRFEFKYQYKQKAFLIFSMLFFAFGLMQGSQGFATALVDYNSPYQINFNIGISTLGCEFIIMFFAISGILRDKKHQMGSIIFSTPITKKDFFKSRFLGVFLFSLLAFSMVLAGFAVGTFMPGLNPDRLAPFNFGVYISTWLMIVLPNVFICTSVIFSVAILTKNNIATYISAILIYSFYMVGSLYFNSPILAQAVPPSPENMMYAALADPFGLAAFFEKTQFWTPYEKNNQLISFSGFFMWNRIVWVLISSLLLGLTYHFFSFKKSNQKIKKTEEVEEQNFEKKIYQPVQNILFNAKSQLDSFYSLLKIELKNVFKSLPFLAVMLIWIVICFINIYERINSGGDYNDSQYPTTSFLIELTRDPILSLLLIVFFSGEIVWRVRDLKFNGIIDATPASNRVFFLSKMVTLILLPIILISTAVIISIGFQISKGYFHFEMGQYLSSFYFSGMEFFFFILFSLFIQSLVSNKYLGMGITALLIVFLASQLSSYIGIEHPMLQLGRLPSVNYTDMAGYSDTTKSFHSYVLYWNSLGFILALFSFKLWQRGTIHQLSFRLKQLLNNWKKWERVSLIILVILFFTSASFIFHNTNIVNEYTTLDENIEFQIGYEKKYKQYESLEKLVLVDLKTEVNIFPKKGKYNVTANCILENINDTPIQKILITERKPLLSLTLENANLIEYDSIFNTHLFELKTPLLPNQQLNFSYKLHQENTGFKSSRSLVKNGSYISQHDFSPAFGYRGSLELRDNFERAKRGLEKREEDKASANHIQNHQHHKYVPINFETIISTHKNQTAIAPGDLIRQWENENRNFYHYKTSENIIGVINYFSAHYKTKKVDHNGISIEQYYHPKHEFNIQNTEDNTTLALDYCIENFGEYPLKHLRIAEIPGHWPFGGQAMPGTISMVADRFYLIDNSNLEGFDLVAKRTIHEVAHQWWGMILRAKNIEGGSILVEGLAKYTEAVVMEKKYGKGAIWQLSESANRRYFSGRSFASKAEPPLYFVDDESYLSYGKNYTVMLALKELIGEQNINKVLKKMVAKHRSEREPTATSVEFINELYLVSPTKYHSLIDDWMKRIITYDLKIEDTNVQKINEHKYEITASIFAKRFETQKDGEANLIEINEPIQVGVFNQHPKNIASEKPILYLEDHQIDQEKMEIKIIVKELPTYISIDPFGTRSDKNRIDNLKRLN